MSPYINIAVEAARAAGRIITKAFERPDLIKKTSKGERDFATDTDFKAEQVIIDAIRKAYPKHAILAEESGAQGKDEFTWIIDPLDGTKNFAHSLPHFAISIALAVKGRVEQAVIYDPMRDELFTASLGRGAQLNGRRLRMEARAFDDALVSISYPNPSQSEAMQVATMIARVSPHIGAMRNTGSAVLDLAYIAAGRLDACFANKLKPWDHSAGILMIQEAGGFVTDWKGGDTFAESGQILASHPKIYKQLLKVVS
jgi:myo-inositol-1(or 4)-monophosphatase